MYTYTVYIKSIKIIVHENDKKTYYFTTLYSDVKINIFQK